MYRKFAEQKNLMCCFMNYEMGMDICCCMSMLCCADLYGMFPAGMVRDSGP